MSEAITVSAEINSPVAKVWDYYTQPEHITQWNNASEDWHTPRAENDLRPGGHFLSRMESRDGTQGFDFTGTYEAVEEHKLIKYTMDDDRKVTITLSEADGKTKMDVTFDPETENTPELQRSGWQAILDNFKSYVESH
ncbi:MAG: SRPBCC family protein [Candidatus Doudnabacteria bacterium]|nr:SRPBCC family protein [Candidatus Doudnabacteria bacterium]